MVLWVRDLTFGYPGEPRLALERVCLEVERGCTLAVVGPSGAGKTTLLRIVAGLLRPRSGDVGLDERSIRNQHPQQRRIALIAQDDALFTNMTVRENLRFALRRGKLNDGNVVETALALHVADYLDRRPRKLSGGERQRASIARALLSDPVALLLDEPLAHLDPSLRRSVRDEVLGVRARFDGPILYVTHDHAEAMGVGDKLAVLIEGRIEDVGDPQRVYDSPRSLTVARFLGDRPMNLFESGGVIVGIRPEAIRLAAGAAVGGRVARRESIGADAYLDVETERGLLTVRVTASAQARAGDLVALELPAAALRRFDPATGLAIA